MSGAMGASSVPSPTFGPNGVVVPNEQDILTGILADMNAAFGNRLNITNLSTSQGQMAQTWTAAVGDKNNMFLYFVQMIDPLYSEGRMQDAIAKIYFITRNPPASTVVTCICTGRVGTYIPEGTLAIDQSSNVYACLGGGQIDLTGSVTLTFAAVIAGPTACPAGSLNGVYQTIVGWDSITNPDDGIVGVLAESPADFEARRSASVAVNGSGSTANVRGAVLNVAGVVDAYVTDNPTGSPVTVQGVTLSANSLYVAVAGGADADVAQAIFTKKSPGATMVGNTTVTVYDPSYTDDPKPSYAITFQRAAGISIKMLIQITATANIPSNAVMTIQNAVVAAFLANSTKGQIGGTVYAGRFFSIVEALGNWANDVIDIFVGTTAPASSKTVSVNLNQIPTMAPADVTVVFI